MPAYTYRSKGRFEFTEKPKPTIRHGRDAIVNVTLSGICSGDLYIKHGSVPRTVEGIPVGHEMVGIVEEAGSAVKNVKPGGRVTVNAETFCGECIFCKKGYVNNCTDKNGGADGCDCEETLRLIAEGKLNTEPLITHTDPLSKIDGAYELFENKRDGVIKVAVEC